MLMSSFSIKAMPTYVLASLCLLAPRDIHPILPIHLEVFCHYPQTLPNNGARQIQPFFPRHMVLLLKSRTLFSEQLLTLEALVQKSTSSPNDKRPHDIYISFFKSLLRAIINMKQIISNNKDLFILSKEEVSSNRCTKAQTFSNL